MDNVNSIKTRRKGYKGRMVEYDQMHVDENNKGMVYVFKSSGQLLADFTPELMKY